MYQRKKKKNEGFHPNTFCLFDFSGFTDKVEFVPLDLNQMQTNRAGTSNFVSSEGNFEHCHPIHICTYDIHLFLICTLNMTSHCIKLLQLYDIIQLKVKS